MPDDPSQEKIYRCPVCFSRENDVYLFRDGVVYYCVKCSFTGTLEQILEMYADLRKKYRWNQRRLKLDEQREL